MTTDADKPATETVLITGASRGLGRLLAVEFLARGLRVVACARDPVTAGLPTDHPRLRPERLDVADEGAIGRLAVACVGERIDILVHNAAQRGDVGGLESFRIADLTQLMAVNVAGPVRLTQALLPVMAANARIAFISSRAGSCAEGADPDGDYAYCASKAALNRIMVKMADDLTQIPFALHPGWMGTDMGGPDAPLDPSRAAVALADLILEAGEAHRGTFRDWQGVVVGW